MFVFKLYNDFQVTDFQECRTDYLLLQKFFFTEGFSVDWWALGVLMFEMMAGRSPFDIVGSSDNPDQNTEDYLFQGNLQYFTEILCE